MRNKISIALLVLLASAFLRAENSPEKISGSESMKTPIVTEKMIRKGNKQIGGGFSFTGVKNRQEIGLYPTVGFLFSDMLEIGSSLSFNYVKVSGQGTTTAYGLGPYLNFYFHETEHMVWLVGQSLSVSSVSSNYSGGGQTYFGPRYFLAANLAVGIDFGMSYGIAPLNTNDGTIYTIGSISTYF